MLPYSCVGRAPPVYSLTYVVYYVRFNIPTAHAERVNISCGTVCTTTIQ